MWESCQKIFKKKTKKNTATYFEEIRPILFASFTRYISTPIRITGKLRVPLISRSYSIPRSSQACITTLFLPNQVEKWVLTSKHAGKVKFNSHV